VTALDIITNAMKKANTIEAGEAVSSDEAADGLTDLNDMIDGWQTERLMLYATIRQVFTLTAGQAAYQMGTGAPDFNVPRPVRIDRMSIISLANPAQPLELPLEYLTQAEWAMVPVKQVLSSLPQRCYDDNGFPFRTLTFWCIPAIQVQTAIYSWGQLSQFADLSTDYQFPPGYADAIKWNLAYRFAGQFGPYMPPNLPMMAVETKAKVKSVNIPLVDLRCDDALINRGLRKYNWLSDSPVGSR
jgi:hypothetical protein